MENACSRASTPVRVLVFQRDATARDWLRARVQARGHTVVALGDADSVASAYDAQPAPLLLLDWSGPDGASLSRRIRAACPWERCVILATGLSDRPAELQAALDAGADDCLSTPLDAGSLEARMLVAERRVAQIDARVRTEERLQRLQPASLESRP